MVDDKKLNADEYPRATEENGNNRLLISNNQAKPIAI